MIADHLKRTKYRPIYRFTAAQNYTSQFSHHIHGLVTWALNYLSDVGFLKADVDTDNQNAD